MILLKLYSNLLICVNLSLCFYFRSGYLVCQNNSTLVVARKIGRRLIEFIDDYASNDWVIDTLQELFNRLQVRGIVFDSEVLFVNISLVTFLDSLFEGSPCLEIKTSWQN